MVRESTLEIPKYLKWRGPNKDRAYWEPTAEMRFHGFQNKRLTGSLIQIYAAAGELNARWESLKNGGSEKAPAPQTIRWWRRKYTGQIDPRTKKRLRDASHKFNKLGKRTQKDYNYYLDFFEERFGGYLLQSLTPKVIKTYYEATCANRGDYFGYHLMIAIRSMLSWCVSEDGFGRDGNNPALKVSVSTPPSRETIWTPENVDLFCAKAIERGRRSVMLAVKLAEWIAQRPTDVRLIEWRHYVGTKLVGLKSTKKNKNVPPVPLSAELIKLIDETPRDHIKFMIVSEGTRQEYTEVNFERVFADIRAAAGLPKELQFRDFRRTAITEGFDAGATTEEGRSLSTHSNPSSMKPYALQTEAKVATLMEKRVDLRAKRRYQEAPE